MDPLHLEYLKEIADADQPIWDDKYSLIEIPFDVPPEVIEVYYKIYKMYLNNTDLNIDKRFYYWARSYSEKIKNLVHRSIASGDGSDRAAIFGTFILLSATYSFSDIQTIKNDYVKYGGMIGLMLNNYNNKLFMAQSLEQYVVFIRASMMVDLEDCLEFIPKIDLEDREFSQVYNRIRPFILRATSGLRTKSANNIKN